MSVLIATDSALPLEIAEHPFVILKYHSEACGEPCRVFMQIFDEISEDPRYKDVFFLHIDVDTNPVARDYILKRKQPMVTVYRNGLLIETTLTTSRQEVEALLDKLLVT